MTTTKAVTKQVTAVFKRTAAYFKREQLSAAELEAAGLSKRTLLAAVKCGALSRGIIFLAPT